MGATRFSLHRTERFKPLAMLVYDAADERPDSSVDALLLGETDCGGRKPERGSYWVNSIWVWAWPGGGAGWNKLLRLHRLDRRRSPSDA